MTRSVAGPGRPPIGKRVVVRLHDEDREKLQRYCAETGLSYADALRAAVAQYFGMVGFADVEIEETVA